MKFKVGDRIIPMTSKFIEGGVIINVMDNDEPFITNIGSTARGRIVSSNTRDAGA